MTTVSEMEVEASAGPGAWNDEFGHEKGRWSLPEGMIRHEGDRLVVDTARPVREPPRKAKAPMIRLLSANPDYPPYTRLACDIHIVGKVLWKVTRAKRAGAARRGPQRRRQGGASRAPHHRIAPRSIRPCFGGSLSLAASLRVPSRPSVTSRATCQRAPVRQARPPPSASESPA